MTSEIKKKYYYIFDKEKLQLPALITHNLLRNSLARQLTALGRLPSGMDRGVVTPMQAVSNSVFDMSHVRNCLESLKYIVWLH